MATTVNYANVILKDKDGNIGTLRSLSQNDVAKIQQGLDDVALIVDSSTHELIKATDTVTGATRFATSVELNAGAANLAVDAAAFKSLSDKMIHGVHYKGTVATFDALPADNVEAGDMYNVTAAFNKDGIDYPAGTNVIADTSSSTVEWDVLDGDPSGYAKQAVGNTFTAANVFEGAVTAKSTVDLTAATTTVAAPTADAHAANKKYVDDAITTLSDGIVNYSASAPEEAAIKNNTVTFFPATDLLS